MRSAALAIGALLGGLLLLVTARAEPPPGANANSPLAGWFHGLNVPAGPLAGMLCCDVSDCRPVQAELRGDGHYWAWIDSRTYPDSPDNEAQGHAPNKWLQVPDAVILPRKENLAGEPIACWYAGEIRCFVRGPET